MHDFFSLNGTWDLIGTDEQPGYFHAPQIAGHFMLKAAVPAPIHQVLMDAGMVDDPNIGLNSLKARWVEERFWIYRRTFEAPPEALVQSAWLVFDKLEYDAVILLNNVEIGRHANANRPARFNVTGKLKAGENLIVVQIEAGLHSVADQAGHEYAADDLAIMTKRHWHRKPQYQSGWDWQARLMNVGILGDVRLEWANTVRVDQVAVHAIASADLTSAVLTARVAVEGLNATPSDAVIGIHVLETGRRAETTVSIIPGNVSAEARAKLDPNRKPVDVGLCPGPSGQTYDVSLGIDQPNLWWPIGHGEQFRYTVEITLQCGGVTHTETRKVGIRRVEIDQSPHPVEGRYFILKINNRPVFCKGGNWVPADMLYSTVTPERTRELVDLGIQANFNMLRIWGGGLFADHVLCEACDEAGMLIWHDFLFACSKYPGDDPAFLREVRRETTWALRELSHHASLVVWCGNNEIETGDWEWGYEREAKVAPHYALFHRELPRMARLEDPATAYCISSPFSPDYGDPNDPTLGDQHPWGVSLSNPGPPDWWIYRKSVDRFPNEGGVLGATSPATLRQFLPENERYLFSPTWEHHDNIWARRGSDKGGLGRTYEAIQLWTGRDPLTMEFTDYAFVSGLLLGDALTEYISNYRRRMFSSASAIFWMYNDSWPATNGWTIVDYYRRKKLAYHPVRRAFQPVTVVVAEEGADVCIFGVNETREAWSGDLRCGIFHLAGGYAEDISVAVELAPNASTLLGKFPKTKWEVLGLTTSGAFAALHQDGALVAQHRLFCARFGDLAFAEPKITLDLKSGAVRLISDVFVWGVCLDVDGESPLLDNCFDLLPGIPYSLPWPDSLGTPRIVAIGSRDAVRKGKTG